MKRSAMMARLALAVPVLGGLASCQDATAPQPPPAFSDAPVQARATQQPLLVFEDVTVRILPSVSDRRLSAELSTQMGEFLTAYGKGDHAAAQDAIERTSRILDRATEHMHPANVSSFRMTLTQAEELLAEGGSPAADAP